MDLLGKKKLLERLRDEAEDLRQWMYQHTSPDTRAAEFETVANRYAIICTRIYIIEKQW